MAADQKPNIFQRSINSLRQTINETVGELRKVHWPTWPEARRLTQIVLVVLVTMSLILGTLDLIYAQLFKLLLGV